MNNTLYLRRRRLVWLAQGEHHLPENVVAALLKNIESLGWTLSTPVQERLCTLSPDDLKTFYVELVAGLRALVGAHREWKPFYPNFPEQVMEMPEAQLYVNAVVHYLTNRRLAFTKQERPPLSESIKLKVVELGSREDFESIFTTLTAAPTSLSGQDREDLAWFVTYYCDDIYRLMPAEIPSRETTALVGGLLLRHTSRADEFLKTHVKTATDVLRLATALSNGDISLAQNSKFGQFSRPVRRQLLSLLDSCPNLIEDMLRWKGRWIRLGERLHPGEYQKRFPQTYTAFETLRNNCPVATFNSQMEAALEKRETNAAVAALRTRPGDFARRLDHLLRLNPEGWNTTLDAFGAVANKVSTPVLLQVWTHFRNRQNTPEFRTFLPKGDVAKVQAVINTLALLPPESCNAVVQQVESTLVERFAALQPLGRCYLDERLRHYIVPFSQRSASKSLRTLSRGSRLPLPSSSVVRFFLWWKNGRERTDIDLSAVIYDGEFVYQDVLSYYNLKGYGGYHSGDIVDAPKGAAEFIDLDMTRLLEKGARYIVMSVNSFTSQPYCDLPECFAGWMARMHAQSGEVFEPKTVQDRIDLASNTEICLPMIVDLVERQVLWTDIALKRNPFWNNVHNNLSGVSLMLRAMTGLQKTNLYDLFALHIRARGELVATIEQADAVFSVEQGLTPFDLDRIAAEFMS